MLNFVLGAVRVQHALWKRESEAYRFQVQNKENDKKLNGDDNKV